MDNKCGWLVAGLLVLLFLGSCATSSDQQRDLIKDRFPDAQGELRNAVESIADDIVKGNIEGLQAMHLESDKFTKFGPRSFDRQDVTSTNKSEAAFFSSVSNVIYEIKDLKIDVFGDIGIVTYYPKVSFVKDGEEKRVAGRQTLVFLKTNAGWKIVHEHGTIRN